MRISLWLPAWIILMATPAWAADAAKPCNAPDQPMRPNITTHTSPPYPPISVMTAEEGTTLLEVSMGADGVPGDVSVVTSSGSVRLDQAAADHVKNNWRWTAPVINCQSQAAKTQVSLTWDLKDAGANVMLPAVYMDVGDYPPDARRWREQGTATIGVAIGADGKVTRAILFQSSGFPDLDARSLELARGWHWVPANLNGRTMNSLVLFRAVWRLSAKK
jgi:TonB family protein